MADGDEAVVSSGLNGLFEHHRAELKRFISARCGDPVEAEDLLQELWLKLADLSVGPIGNGRAYLFRMANNLVLDRVRRRHRSMRRDRAWLERDPVGTATAEDRPDPSPDAEQELLDKEETQVLRAAIASLPAGARRALVAYRFEGMAQGDIATMMGISRSGVEKHLALAMKHLRKHLDDCGYFSSVSSDNRERPGRPDPTLEKTR
ncbi:RNA polymerase sigma factor [Croceibacterium salegens]|nr:sigma-70 family RNA polymerase sigma factor [Croceibacterium salegens]